MDEPTAPAICYDACNNAYLEATLIGQTPSLCDSNGTFKQSHDRCVGCIERYAEDADAAREAYLDPTFQQFISYCNSLSDDLAENVTVVTASIRNTVGGQVFTEFPVYTYTVAPFTGLVPSSPSSSSTPVTTAILNETRTSTGSTILPSTSAAAESTGVNTGDDETTENTVTSQTSTGTIAGSVVGAVLGVVILIAAMIWWMRKRKTRKDQAMAGQEGGNNWAKPELDGDGVIKTSALPPQELQGQGFQELEVNNYPQELEAPWPVQSQQEKLSFSKPG